MSRRNKRRPIRPRRVETNRQEAGNPGRMEPLEPRLLLSTVWYPDLQNLVVPSDNPALPAGMDVFTPPVSAAAPGAGAPGLSEITRIANAGDVLPLTGWQLSSHSGADFGKDTEFLVYSQNSWDDALFASAEVLRLDTDNLQAALRMPDTLPQDGMFLVWAQNADGVSYPLAVNRTEAWWVGSDKVTRGQGASVYGKNLTYQDSTYPGLFDSWVYLQPASGTGRWVSPTAANPYKVDFTVPEDLVNGTYEVWVHNGHGGKYGWSRSPVNLTVQDAPAWNGAVYNVTSFGAVGDGVTDDTAAIQAAITAAVNAGDQIYLPAGTYLTTGSFTIPSDRRVYGDGMGTTKLLATKVTFGGNTRIEDLAFENQRGIALTGDNVWMDAISVHETGWLNYFIVDCGGKANIYVTNSEFIGNKFAMVNRQVHIDHCDFYARYDAEDCIESFWGSRQVSVTNSTFQHYDMSNPSHPSGWGEGRAWVGYGGHTQGYFGNNRTIDFVVRTGGGDQNSGEQLLWEGANSYYEGAIAGATANTVTFNPGGTTPNSGMRVIVVAGKGLGQIRAVASYDGGTQTTTLTEPWNVIPDATSQIHLVKHPDRIVVYQNTFDGTQLAADQTAHVANVGVDTFTGSSHMIIDDNLFHELRTGIVWTTAGNRTVGNLSMNNTFDYVRWGISESGGSSTVGHSVMMNVYRDNDITTVVDTALKLNGSSNQSAPILTVFDGNAVTNVKYVLTATGDPENVVLYGNTFTRGTGAEDGSRGAILTDTDPMLQGNTWSGFETTYAGTLPGPILEASTRALALDAAAGTSVQRKLALLNAGTSSLTWTAGDDATWLTLSSAGGESAAEANSTVTLTCDATGLSDGTYTGTITVSGASQTLKITVSFTVAAAPTVTGYAQAQPVLASGSVITVSGSGFASGCTARVGGVAAALTYVNATTVQVTLPTVAAAAGIFSLEVINPSGRIGSYDAGVGYGRFLDRCTPDDVALSGGTVTVYGCGFEAGTTFTVNGLAVTNLTIVSSREASFTVPAASAVGAATLTASTGAAAFAGAAKLGYHAPYLSPYFGSAGRAALRGRWDDPFYADYRTAMERDFAAKLAQPFDTSSTGSNTGRLNAFLYAYLITGEPQYRDRLMAEAQGIYEYGYAGSGAGMPEMRATYMARVYNALGAELTLPERAIFESYLQSVIDSGSFGWEENVGSNTVAVAANAGGSTALALLHTGYAGCQSVLNSMVSYLQTNYVDKHIRPDGGSEEGVLYWNYGLEQYLEFVHALKNYTGDDQGLLDPVSGSFRNNYRFVETVLAGAPEISMQSFNDSQPFVAGLAMAADFGSRFDQPLMRWLSDFIIREIATGERGLHLYGGFYNAFMWRDHTAAPSAMPAIPTLSVLPDTEWATMRSSGTELYPDLVVAVKGSTPPHTHHGGYDAGSFVLQANGESYLLDPGYFQGYPSDGDQTKHSLPQIDGNGVYDGTWGSTSPNTTLETWWEDLATGTRGVVVDSTLAYHNAAADRCRRIFVTSAMADEGDALIILEDIDPAGAGTITQQYQLGFDAQFIGGRNALVTGDKGRLYLQTFGPDTDFAKTGPRAWGNSWIYAQLDMDWYTVSGNYAASVNQPFITVMTPTGSTGVLPSASVSYGAGVIDVTLSSGQILRFLQNPDGSWDYSAIVTPASPTVSVLATDPLADELATDAGQFAFYRTGDTTNPLTVYYTVGGTAGTGDYTPSLPGSITIPAGSSYALVNITPVDDTTTEIDELLTLTLQTHATYTVHAANGSAGVTIMDDDGAPVVTVVATDPTATETGTNTGTFTLTRNKLRPGPLTVQYAMSGTATNGADYGKLYGSATIPEGQYSVTVVITPVQDGVIESAETAILTLQDGAGYTVGAANTDTVTLTDTGVQNTLTWTGGGANGLWSNPDNWSSSGDHPVPDWGDVVAIGSAAGNRSMTQDIPGLNLYAFTVTQSQAGVTQTLALSENLTVNDGVQSTIPVFTISGGAFVLDVGSHAFSWDAAGVGTGNKGNLPVVIPDGMTLSLAGGSVGLNGQQTTLKVQSGGTISGYGTIYGTIGNPSWGGFNGFILESGATIAVGDGTLILDDGAGQAILAGSLTGTTGNSRLFFGNGGKWAFADAYTPTVSGLTELRIETSNDGLGRFSSPSQFQMSGSTLHAYRPGTLLLEAQTTVADLSAYKVGTVRVSGDFSGYDAVLKLQDTGAVDGDFVYVGQLQNLNVDRIVNLNDQILLTDMTQSALQAFITSGGIINSGTQGAPTVKSVVLNEALMWYVAPANLEITPPLTVRVQATDAGASESGSDTGTFTFTRFGAGATTGDLTVYYSVGGTGSNGVDYTPALSGSVVIPDGYDSVTVTITPADDALAENDETVTLTLLTDAAYRRSYPVEQAATVLIADNEPRVTVVATDAAASEAGPDTGTYTLTRTNGTTGDLTVYYTMSGTAGNGSDYQALSGSAVIPDGQASVTITLTPIDDSAVEKDDETAVLTLTTDFSAYSIGTSGSATVSIRDNDFPTVTIVATDAIASEPGTDTATFTVTRAGSTVGDLVVYYTTTGTANPAADYQPLSGSVTIPDGQASAEITVIPVDDTAMESDETIILTVSSDANYWVGSPSSATATLVDDDAPTITITALDRIAGEEGSSTATFRIHRDKTDQASTVHYTIGGTASNTTDYATLATSVVIPEGQSYVDITVTPVDDSAYEQDETVTLTISTNTMYLVGSPSSATVEIWDNDFEAGTAMWTGGAGDGLWSSGANWSTGVAPTTGTKVGFDGITADLTMTQDIPALSISSLRVVHNATGATLTLNLAENLTVNDATNTTQPDFNVTGGAFVLNIGAKTFTWDNSQRAVKIPDHCIWTLSGGVIGTTNGQQGIHILSGGKLSGTGSVRGTKLNTHWGWDAWVIEEDATLEVGDGVLNFPDASGTTAVGAYFYGRILGTTANSELTMGASGFGNAWRFVCGPNLEVRDLKRLAIAASNDSGFGRFGDDASRAAMASTTLNQWRAGQWLNVEALTTTADLGRFKIGTLRVDGAYGTGETGIKLVDSGSGSGDLVYAGQLVNIGGTTYGNYRRIDLNGVALLTDMTQSALQAIQADSGFKNSGSGGAPTIKSVEINSVTYWYVAPADVSISAVTTPTVTLAATDASAAEAGPDTGSFTVTRTGSTGGDLVVNYTISGTASASDYTPTLSGTVTIPDGQASATITITPVDDADIEPSEDLTLTLASGTGYVIGAQSAATVAITSDDVPEVNIAATDASASEAGPDSGSFTVTRSGSGALTQGDLVVNYTVGGTASASDYTPSLSGTVTIPDGQTSAVITITPVDDADPEATESLSLTLASGSGYSVGAGSSAVVDILDDDNIPEITLAATDAAAAETGADTGTFRVSRTTSVGDLVVNYAIGGTASPSDYTPSLSGTVTILDGQTSADIVITPVDDAEIEGDERLILTLQAGSGYTVGASDTAAVTLADSELPAGTTLWTGAGGTAYWSNAANWSTGLAPGAGGKVYIDSFAADAATIQDIAGLNLHALTVRQADAGATQTLTLEQNLSVNDGVKSTIPTFDVTGGALVFNVANRSFSWDNAGTSTNAGNLPVVIASGMTVNLAGGSIGLNGGQTTLKIASGGKLAGVGTVYGTVGNPSWSGFRGFVLEAGGILEAGDGVLFFDDGGNQVQFFGEMRGTTANSKLRFGQNNAFWVFSGSSTTSIHDLAELRVSTRGGSFGRFGSPSLADLDSTVVEVYAPGNILWEAQTTNDDLSAYQIQEIKLSGSFSGYDVIFKLTDTGTTDHDFVYARTLTGLNVDQYIDLNDQAILTDMTQTALQAFVTGGGFVNTGTQGAPTVKSVEINSVTYWYVAPAGVSIPSTTPEVTLTASDSTAAEAGPDTGTFTVTRSGSTSGDLTVYYTVSGTGSSGTDYAALPGSVVIPDGQASATITLTPIDDSEAESDETVILTLAADSAYIIASPDNGTVTIADDDPTVVTLTAHDPWAGEEGLNTGTFRISRNGSSGDLTVSYTIGGTATNTTDYSTLTTTAVIPSGSSHVDVTVTPAQDTTVEGEETVLLTLATDPAYTIGASSAGTVWIGDNDVPAGTLVWTGGGGDGLWSTGANWSTGVAPVNNDRVAFGSFASNTTVTQDIASLNLYGLYINHATSGVTVTLNLSQNLSVNDATSSTKPEINITDGAFVLNLNNRTFTWDQSQRAVKINAYQTWTLSGGVLGTYNTSTAIRIYDGGTLSGVGTVYCTKTRNDWGWDTFRLESGGTIEVGDGLLNFPDSSGVSAPGAHFGGTIVGTTANSEIQFGYGGYGSPWTFSSGSDLSISGLKRLAIGAVGSGFGRFGEDAGQFSMATAVLEQCRTNGYMEIEALTTVEDLARFKIGTLKAVGSYQSNENGFKLVDTGGAAGDFVYAGQLVNIGGTTPYNYRRIDLNGIALLTDMTQTALQDILDISGFKNTGSGGAPTLKSVALGGTTYWYVAPADVTIAVAADGFEDGLSGGLGWSDDWSLSGASALTTTGSPYAGSSHLGLTGSDGSAVRTADLSGNTNLHLHLQWKANSFETGETAVIEFYDGTSWNTVLTISDGQDDNAYHAADLDLSSYTLTGTNQQVRIRSLMTDVDDELFIDELWFANA